MRHQLVQISPANATHTLDITSSDIPVPTRTPQPGANPLQLNGAALQSNAGKTFYLETFGCQMNVHDSEKVSGVLIGRGYRPVESYEEADLVLYNTCSIREKA